ncbi:hypothetical protein R1sor_025612 [Riccia sorocarpa]|uniref:Uncharacterized protein n=1 Tax=Riccia sorocarpa TaxID=122646 RepID=A0ABD3GER7_9MARC
MAAQVDADSMDRNVQGTIVFATVGRAHFGFDVFALTLPEEVHGGKPDSIGVEGLKESRLTDGVSVNYNGQLVEGEGKAHLLQWLTRNCGDPVDDKPNDIFAGSNKELMLYVSERDGTARIYVTLLSVETDRDQKFIRNDGAEQTDDPENKLTNLAISGSRGLRALQEDGSRRILLQCKFSQTQTFGSHLQDRPQVRGRRIIYVSTEQATN